MKPKARIIPIFVPHAGCPGACVFCNQRLISGSGSEVTAETVTRVLEDAGKLRNAPHELAFYGGSFTALPESRQEELLGAALPFVRSGTLSGVRVSTRPDAADAEALDRLARYRVGKIEIGAQSMIDGVLEKSGRGHSAEDTVRAARMIKDRGFELIIQMMTGLPGSSEALDIESARCIAGLKPDGVRIYPAVVIKETALYDLWKAGEYREHTTEEAIRVCAVIVPLFEKAGTAVIRIGLNPSEELSGGSAAAGAYHPALGELVRSAIMLDKAEKLLEKAYRGHEVVFGVNRSRVSAMTGNRRANLIALSEKFSLKSVKVRPADVDNDEVILISASAPAAGAG